MIVDYVTLLIAKGHLKRLYIMAGGLKFYEMCPNSPLPTLPGEIAGIVRLT